jgi:serine/threonine protein kinase
MASTAAEMQLHPGDPPMEPKSDLSQARALAGLVATSEPSVEAFVKFGLEEAKSIVEKYRSLLLAMTRTLIAHPDRILNARDAFYEMLTGQLPFTATDPMEWVHCHVARQPVPPNDRGAGVPGPLSAIVMKLLAKTGEERYQTAAGVEADQRRCLTEWEATGSSSDFSSARTTLPIGSRSKTCAIDRLASPKLRSFHPIALYGPSCRPGRSAAVP